MVEATDLQLAGTAELLDTLKRKAQRHQDLPMVGRTHGIHAEPVTRGFRIAPW
jgi:adenylosuccinate lyase